ncbi:hypothetical protein BTO05_09965 [Winogradskyella sp. PC-19]|uniref:hypothetical protein n=1 Tax=unclassified Winogradskyella TaxID=2615021 RepID=UPI000B3CACCB|nr:MULTISPECIES: hypothetical protein [unclassified Winogradskyella]ARV09944.1 hypothetical protein BTO05_09965 [Winogradskyella sp. PC-19]RZN84383.1 MAG: hypothetical protein EVB12_00410 [Winogradskyella sp.]
MQLPKSFEALVDEANRLKLYKALIIQLNKDLSLANIDLEFSDEVLPTSLKLILKEEIYNLIQNRFTEYLNLLYIIDVAEAKVRDLDGDDTIKLSEDITFLILQREWQKVWYKANY